jgi:L-threonylcarbamoyladenylate synthase
MMLIGNDIGRAAGIVKNGGVIAYPTETVYGVGALATDVGALQRVYQIKERPMDQPLSIAVSGMEMLRSVAKVECEDFILKFLPGPVTVILKKRKTLPGILTAGSKYVGIRWPDHHMALALISATGPIVSTSANRHGEKDPVAPGEVSIPVDYVLDGGPCRYGAPSTIVNLHECTIVRKGAMYEEVRRYLYGCGCATEE